MKQLIAALHADTRVRYVVIGGSTFIVELIVLFAAQAAGAPGTLAVAISFLVGLGASFLLQKVITFNDKNFHKKMMAKQVVMYTALVVFNFCFTIAAVWLLENYLPVVFIRTVALATTVMWNYYLYRTWIFNKNT